MIRKKRPEQLKTKLIQIKVTPETKKDFEEYAISKGYTLTYLIEMSVKRAMKRDW